MQPASPAVPRAVGRWLRCTPRSLTSLSPTFAFPYVIGSDSRSKGLFLPPNQAGPVWKGKRIVGRKLPCRAQTMLQVGVRPPASDPRLETGGFADLLHPSKVGLGVCGLVSTVVHTPHPLQKCQPFGHRYLS